LKQLIEEGKNAPPDEAKDLAVFNAITVIGTWAKDLDASILDAEQKGLADEAKALLSKYEREFQSDPTRWRKTIDLMQKLLKAAEEKGAVQAR